SLVFATDRLLNLPATASASVTGGTATVGVPAVGPNANQVTVPLTNVPDLQNVVVSLNGVKDATGTDLGPQSARLRLLLGDTNVDGTVNSADAAVTRSVSGQTTAAGNFRSDVNTDGTVNSADAAIVRSRSGNTIPAAVSADESR
ncbi:MAG: dockerin type I repeat-containing protein, partial [Verrucomicrobiota bacterium]|nr:dockerin type I repeat-containing protein [Verrucomicrobiota bacterium]